MTFDQHIAAGIDLGSGTFRLLVADCNEGNLVTIDKKMATVRLGQGLEESKTLHEQNMARGLEVLSSFRASLDHYQPQSIRACGTHALRQAKNSEFFLQKAQKVLGLEIDIITDRQEALLSLAGMLHGFKGQLSGNCLLVDVGGGSSELIFRDPVSGENRVESIPLGAVSLTEKFFAAAQPESAQLDGLLTETVGDTLKKLKFPEKNQNVVIVGSGGTATSMAALDLNLANYDEALVHGHTLQAEELEALWSKLIKLSADARNRLPCLDEGRGEILPAGLRIYQVMLQLTQQKRMMISDTGLLEGILLSSFADIAI